VRLDAIKRALTGTIRDVNDHHTLQTAAGLAYYFTLSVFPALIALSAILGLIPVPNLFSQVIGFLRRILPPEGMHAVNSVLRSVLSSNSREWLSVGMLGLIWTTSSAFTSIIESLDIAYDVEDTRPFWKVRLIAIGLAFLCGTLLLISLGVMIVGPKFGGWLAGKLQLSWIFAAVWPALRWILAITFTVLAVEIIYFLAPRVQQRFWSTLPGAILFVVFGDALSFGLGFYFRSFAHFNKMYGTLGGFVAFMTWFYWTSFVLLVGAELNAELAKESKRGSLSRRPATPADPSAVEPDLPRAA